MSAATLRDNSEDGAIQTDQSRICKGKSLVFFPSDYVVVDLETTGLSPKYDEIIEIAALRIRSGEIVDTYQTLVKPQRPVDEFITKLTGITNETLSSAPTPDEIVSSVRQFIGESIIIGHNVNFDINFLYDLFESKLRVPLTNNYVDTLNISRKILTDLPQHKLKDVAMALNVDYVNAHRALDDCRITNECFKKLHDVASARWGDANIISQLNKTAGSKNVFHTKSLHDITPQGDTFDETHPLYQKRCVFTGELAKLSRTNAAQMVVNVGGICDNGITKNTNFLIVGSFDYCNAIKGDKSGKLKKAEEYRLKGIDIEIIPEDVFYDMIKGVKFKIAKKPQEIDLPKLTNFEIKLLSNFLEILKGREFEYGVRISKGKTLDVFVYYHILRIGTVRKRYYLREKSLISGVNLPFDQISDCVRYYLDDPDDIFIFSDCLRSRFDESASEWKDYTGQVSDNTIKKHIRKYFKETYNIGDVLK